MSSAIQHVGFKVHVYPEEMMPLLKLVNHASDVLSKEEVMKVTLLIDEIKDKIFQS